MYQSKHCNFLMPEVSCWTVTGERQARRIRGLYLKALLRQDVAFFDNETTTGEAIERITGDTALIQDAIGPKVRFISLIQRELLDLASNYIQTYSSFIFSDILFC